MTATHARMEFAPPPTPGLVRALGLAIAVHTLLLAILTLGLQWKRDAPPVTVEAELWSALPLQSAPPPPDPVPAPAPPEPASKPLVKEIITPVPTPAPTGPDPRIVIAKEKARLQREKQLEQERLDLEKRQKDALKAKKVKEEKDARDKALREKMALTKQLEQQKAHSAQAEADAKKVAELRKQQIERMNRMADQANGTGSPGSMGTAKQSSGPSASYAGRIRARIKPNITYTESIVGNPEAEVEVRTSPNGTIIGRKLVKSSGVKSWDDAVLNAVDKTEVLPPDVDGRVVPSLIIVFSPKG